MSSLGHSETGLHASAAQNRLPLQPLSLLQALLLPFMQRAYLEQSQPGLCCLPLQLGWRAPAALV